MSVTDFTLTSKLTFGKHKGETVQWVIDHDPGYLDWCLDNIEWFILSKEAARVLRAVDNKWRDDDDLFWGPAPIDSEDLP